MISLGGGFNLLAPCKGVTAAVWAGWIDDFAASVLFPWKKIDSITIDKRAAPPMKTAILVCRSSLCRIPISSCSAAKYLSSADTAGVGAGFGFGAGLHQCLWRA